MQQQDCKNMDKAAVKSYYQLGELGYISNSDLSALNRELYGGFRPSNLSDIFAFGNLFDYMITEPDKINEEFGFIYNEHNVKDVIEVSQSDIKLAKDMREAYLEHPTVKATFLDAKMQHIVIRERLPVTMYGKTIYIKARIKLDLVKPRVIGGDIKTTTCRTLEDFKDSIFNLNYDRQGAYYMDVAKLDRFMFIGVCRHKNKNNTHDIFIYPMQKRTTEYYTAKDKYAELVFTHKMNQLLN